MFEKQNNFVHAVRKKYPDSDKKAFSRFKLFLLLLLICAFSFALVLFYLLFLLCFM